MGRGLGAAQKLVLLALQELEREHGSRMFSVAEIHDRVATIAALSHVPTIKRDRAQAEWSRRLEADAAAGDRLSSQILSLGETIASRRKSPRRPKERHQPKVDDQINLSRTLGTLELRGLIERSWASRQGQGWATLTDKGRGH